MDWLAWESGYGLHYDTEKPDPNRWNILRCIISDWVRLHHITVHLHWNYIYITLLQVLKYILYLLWSIVIEVLVMCNALIYTQIIFIFVNSYLNTYIILEDKNVYITKLNVYKCHEIESCIKI